MQIGAMLVVIFLIYVILPLLGGIVLPAVIIPAFTSWMMNRKKKGVPSIVPYILNLILGGLAAYLGWSTCVRGVLYHAWDSGLELPYSFFGREPISLSGVGDSWIAEGWSEWQLDLLWISLTLGVYALAFTLSWIKNRKSPEVVQYVRTIAVSSLVLIVVTMLVPRLGIIKMNPLEAWFYNANPDAIKFEEKEIPCPSTTATEPKIVWNYNAENGEVISDLDGGNQRVAFEKDVQLRGAMATFSPDESKVVATAWWNQYWIMCTHSNGATKIELPEFSLNRHVSPKSKPSWSPDGQKLAVNLYGDLAIIDIKTKKIEFVKKNVALRDNHVDLTSKDRERNTPAYEVGTVYWARDGVLYYSSFEGELELLHQYNLADMTDKVILTTTERIAVKSGDPTGRYLLIDYDQVNQDRSFASPGKLVILDTTNGKEVVQFDSGRTINIVWSPSGDLFAQSYSDSSSPAYVSKIDSSDSINISDLVASYVETMEEPFGPGRLAVAITDFVGESQVVTQVMFHDIVDDYHYAFANLLVNFRTQEVKVLQAYPKGQATGKELFPLKVLNVVATQ